MNLLNYSQLIIHGQRILVVLAPSQVPWEGCKGPRMDTYVHRENTTDLEGNFYFYSRVEASLLFVWWKLLSHLSLLLTTNTSLRNGPVRVLCSCHI